METDPGVGPFVWFFSSYTQFHAAAIILGELISNPESTFKERAWKCLDEMFALSNSPQLAWAKGITETTDWKLCKGLYEKACSTRTWDTGPAANIIAMTSSDGYSIPFATAGRMMNPNPGFAAANDIDWVNLYGFLRYYYSLDILDANGFTVELGSNDDERTF